MRFLPRLGNWRRAITEGKRRAVAIHAAYRSDQGPLVHNMNCSAVVGRRPPSLPWLATLFPLPTGADGAAPSRIFHEGSTVWSRWIQRMREYRKIVGTKGRKRRVVTATVRPNDSPGATR